MTKNKKRIALISGASSGIGRAIALNLAKEGYELLLLARRKDRLDELSRMLENETKVYQMVCDIRSLDQIKGAWAAMPQIWKNIDVLINNAGLAAGLDYLHEGKTSDWEEMIDTNIKGLLYLSRLVIPEMVRRSTGHVVNIGSIAGKEVYEKGVVYCGTKHMVDALSKGMRMELAEHGIRVTAIHPGAVETEFSLVRFKGDQERAKAVYDGFDQLFAEDISEAVIWTLSRPAHVNINDLVIMPQAQPSAGKIVRR